MSKGKSILLGILVGTTASAVATLLTTPSSGKDVRVRIKDQSFEWKDAIDEMIQDGLNLKEQIAKTSKEGAALINDLTQEMKTSIEEWKIAVEPNQENIHNYLEQIETSIKDLETKLTEQDNKQ
ncbi:MAG TPA: YtxH domain-containing protein [Pseudogracilibacillus sp.]|nr:YtxH domain-containing protein [Pseudogracilibacillus sp.]